MRCLAIHFWYDSNLGPPGVAHVLAKVARSSAAAKVDAAKLRALSEAAQPTLGLVPRTDRAICLPRDAAAGPAHRDAQHAHAHEHRQLHSAASSQEELHSLELIIVQSKLNVICLAAAEPAQEPDLCDKTVEQMPAADQVLERFDSASYKKWWSPSDSWHGPMRWLRRA